MIIKEKSAVTGPHINVSNAASDGVVRRDRGAGADVERPMGGVTEETDVGIGVSSGAGVTGRKRTMPSRGNKKVG